MNDSTEQRVTMQPEGEISFIDLWWLVWDKRLLVGVVTAACVAVALVFALTATPLYRATVVMTEVRESGLDAERSIGGGVGALASLAGINTQEHPERSAVLRSRHLVDEFVARPDVFSLLTAGEKDPKKLGRWMTVELFRKNVVDIQEDKFKGTFTITMDWKDPAVASRWANEFAALANGMMRDKAIEDATRNLAFLKEQVEHTNSVELQSVFYRMIEQQTRTLMLARGRSEYAFMIVDPAVKPELRFSPKRTLMVLGGLVIGLFLGTYIAWLRMRIARHRRTRGGAGPAR